MRMRPARLGTVVAAAVVAVTVVTGAVSASAGGGMANFAAGARGAGVTSAQIRALEQEVNAFIGRYGGTQIAVNKVDFNGGSILFTVPGQNARRVADVSAGRRIETADSSTCPVGDYCE